MQSPPTKTLAKYEIIDLLLNIPDFNINQRNKAGLTILNCALMKRDFKSLVMIFSFPNLELNHEDFEKSLQAAEDVDNLIQECHIAQKMKGYNYSDVVDFLMEVKKRIQRLSRRFGRKKGRGF